MTHPSPEDHSALPPDPEEEVPVTEPAHRAALLVMVATPLLLGAAVYALLKALGG